MDGEDRRPAAHGIAEDLIDRIRSGVLEVGQVLPTERELCVQFSASRSTVREALRLMAERNYAVVGGSRRPCAARPSLDGSWSAAITGVCEALGEAQGLAQIEQIRQFIECSAAAYAAREATQSQLIRLGEALGACESALGDHDRYVAADRAFHVAIIACVGNPALDAMLETFLARLIAGRDLSDRVLENDRISCGEHRALFEAILSGDADRAAAIMERHLNRAFRERLRGRLGGD
jgi:DNA-binding FadR family transcriptional regulator